MDWFQIVIAVAIPVVVALVTWGFRALARASWATKAEADFAETAIAAVQRTKDKVLEEVMIAQRADSEGGAEITAQEKSNIRQRAFDLLMHDLSGPALAYAKDKGEAFVKGKLGGILDSLLEKLGIKTKGIP